MSSPSASQATEAVQPVHPALHVLAVDDDPDIRWTLRALLTSAGYTVEEAADGAQALDVLRSSPHALVVLLDLQMPAMSGANVLEAVALDAALVTRHTYLLLTANARTLTLRFVNLLSKLGVPVIAKPFDADELMVLVAQAAARLP